MALLGSALLAVLVHQLRQRSGEALDLPAQVRVLRGVLRPLPLGMLGNRRKATWRGHGLFMYGCPHAKADYRDDAGGAVRSLRLRG